MYKIKLKNQILFFLFFLVFLSSCQSKLRGQKEYQYFIKRENTINNYAYDEWINYHGKLMYFNSYGYIATNSELPYGYKYDDKMNIYREDMKIIKFGKFEQDGNIENGIEDIEWIIIDEDNESYKLLSLYGLECKLFTNIYSNDEVLWKDSYIRNYLNVNFISVAFTDEEKNRIVKTTIRNNDIDGALSEDTYEYVYLLSENEIYRYFPKREQRICYATQYARKNGDVGGAYTLKNGECCWLSRTSCYTWSIVGISCYGEKTSLSNCSGYEVIRPVVCIKK